MTLPIPNLDDLRFQSDLVDEARKRIINYCPEWTEYNLSDPGITLIELFAWMTELMVYRLNRVPEKNYIKFLEMLGLQRLPASSARTELTFWLSVPLPIEPGSKQTVAIPAGFEVRSEQSEESVPFTTSQALVIVPPILAHVRREADFNRNFVPRMGLELFLPFDSARPRPGDTFYLGFAPEASVRGHILQLAFSSEPTEAVGVRREDPPWVWECLCAGGVWQEVRPSQAEGEKDTTGGLNNAEGRLTLYLPLNFEPGMVHGLEAFWLRCRYEQRHPGQGEYNESPRVRRVDAFSLGGSVPAMNSMWVEAETLGASSGEPGQSYALQHAPVLALQSGETVEVEETRGGETVYAPWEVVDSFARSTRYDRHFRLDMAGGQVHFGPSVRQADGSVAQYGRVPESGRRIRFARYRFGGGVKGNLPAGSLNTLSTSLAYVSRVSNLVRAIGGRDQESLEELKLRAQRELQAQRRAVTAADFEQFASDYSRSVGRAKCLTPNDQPGVAAAGSTLLIVPAVGDAVRAGTLGALKLDDTLRAELRDHLDRYRLLTSPLTIREPHYFGVKVKARVVPQDFVSPSEVQARVDEELRRFLSPLRLDGAAPLPLTGESWDGWVFGRELVAAEVIALIQRVPAVKFVLDVEISSRAVTPSEEKALAEDETPPELEPVGKVLRLPPDGLVCSLAHEIEITSIETAYRTR